MPSQNVIEALNTLRDPSSDETFCQAIEAFQAKDALDFSDFDAFDTACFKALQLAGYPGASSKEYNELEKNPITVWYPCSR